MASGGGFLPSDHPASTHLAPERPRTIPAAQLISLSERAQSILIRRFDADLDRLIGGMKAKLVSSPFRELGYALESATKLLNLVLAVPPFGSDASLRTSYLLRFTGDMTSALDQYTISTREQKASIFSLYDLLDRGWLCCLRAQIWDRALERGVSASEIAEREGGDVPPIGQVTMTERSRLLSLALRCKESLAIQTHAHPVLDSEVDDLSDSSSDDNVDTQEGSARFTQAGSVVGATSLALGGLFGRTLAFLDNPIGAGTSVD